MSTPQTQLPRHFPATEKHAPLEIASRISRSHSRCIGCNQAMGELHTTSCSFAKYVAPQPNLQFNVAVRNFEHHASYVTSSPTSASALIAAIDRFGVCAISVTPVARSAS